ncbi:WEB family protein At5g16730, chloroplastic-like [Solanum stenotomum]|uniref:WEB family protein At5g16730, chloroplastic-like n=1 Tax=Solanum stenotomum TaxID=172797 RepID=UPI0020D0AB60|nr:WEB family protein At5g16730, chloroplastic-like [Solanum stenotomum]
MLDQMGKFEEEVKQMKEVAHEAQTMDLVYNFKKRVHELEAEVANRRLTESRIFDSLASQTREFELTKIELEESKVEISLLHEEIESLVSSSEQNSWHCDGSCSGKIALEKELGCLKFELGLAKANLAMIQERERFASSKANALSDEMHLVRNELKFATYAEEKSQKALDDLALALKEIAAEAYEAKEKLSASQLEFEQVKDEAGQLKHMVRNAEARYKKLLNEAKKETELHRETTDRLRLEFDESRLAENETRYITCIKKVEEEKKLAQDEAATLAESLKAAERITRAAKREVYKLKGILKQAINEADAANTAAGLARDENIQLKDYKAENEESIRLLTQENERLGINEVAAQENVKKSKRFLSSSVLKTEDKEQEEEHNEDPHIKKTSSSVNLQQEQGNLEAKIQDENLKKAKALKDTIFEINESPKSELHIPKQVSHHRRASSFAFPDDRGTPKTKGLSMSLSKSSSSLNTKNKEQKEERYEELQVPKKLKLQQEQEDLKEKIQDKDPEKAETLERSIIESPKPKADPHTPKKVPHHRISSSSSSSDDGGSLKSEDPANDRNPIRKKRTLFRKVGDLIRRKSFHKTIH